MSEKELKPCPFCGEQVFTPLVSSLDNGYTRCISCGAKMQRSRWQTRPIEDALNKRIAELEESDKHWAGNVKVCMQLIERYESDIAELEESDKHWAITG